MGLLKIGRMDRRVRFEQRASGQDPDYGTPVDSWTAYATVYAELQEQLPSRGERVAEGLRIAERPTRLRCRYDSGITSDMRVIDLDRNRTLKIVTPPVELGRKEGLEMMVVEYSTEGSGS